MNSHLEKQVQKNKAISTSKCTNSSCLTDSYTAKQYSEDKKAVIHPDHRAIKMRLRRLQGQIAGIERMVDEQRYCMEILTQFRAAFSALRSIEAQVLEKHIQSCVQSAMSSKNKKAMEQKITELIELMLKR